MSDPLFKFATQSPPVEGPYRTFCHINSPSDVWGTDMLANWGQSAWIGPVEAEFRLAGSENGKEIHFAIISQTTVVHDSLAVFMNGSPSLNTVPQEVLEHIAFFAGTNTLIGPPSSLILLLLTNRRINASLSITFNHHLYARIFCRKFDTAAPLTRLGADRLTSWALAHELRKRFGILQRLRARLDSTTHARHAEEQDEGVPKMRVYDVLFTAYIMMLENEGMNRLQLVEYGRMNDWIREFWFDTHGASLAIYSIRIGQWPLNRPETALGMWLFWFLLNTDDYGTTANDGVESPLNIIKAMALGAHIYGLTNQSWIDFEPKPVQSQDVTTLYAENMVMNPPPLAIPAILSFLALVNKRRSIPLPPSDVSLSEPLSQEWDSEWGRCFTKTRRHVAECFMPGSLEGVWEGFFTYTEFTAYASMLAGAPPTVIQKGVVGRHQQTWKIREHHLLATDHSDSDSGIDMDVDNVTPLRAGDPLRSYFPTGTHIREHKDGLCVQDAGSTQVRRYQRASALETHTATTDYYSRVKDIIVTGEGHSAWGQFNLVGRIRPCDGFISLSKDYVDGDRGKWLYRAYLVGNGNGNLAGRWRDTLSPADVPGYEGCFVMTRRR